MVVDGRVVVLEAEQLETGAARLEIQLAADGQHRVAHRLGVQPLPIHPPKQPIVRIDFRGKGVLPGRLAVASGEQDQPMQLLERAAGVAELQGQPVE